MSSFDDIDRQILELLLEDARRPFRGIADEVGLSAPAVSDRIDRLRDRGVIRRFTVDLDRATLATAEECLLTVRTSPTDAETLATQLSEHDAVEHVHRGVSGTITATAHMDAAGLDESLNELAEASPDAEWSVEPLADSQWEPEIGVTGAFGLVCTICGNTVSDDGETVEVESGDRHVVCCSACATQITDEYDRLSSGQ